MLKIGEFSKLAQVSIKTLRYYAELGLLKPDWVDRYTGYRYYTLQQLPRLNRILTLKELGFPLVQIERLLHENLSVDELRRLMRLRQAELEEHVRVEQMRLDQVAARLRLIEQEGRQPHYEVVTRPIPAMLVAGIRDTVEGDGNVRHLFEELRHSVAEWGITPGPLTPFIAVYYDWEYCSSVEVVVPLDKRRRARGRVEIHELPGIDTAACLVHEGRSDQFTAAYQALTQWTQVHGYRRASHNREVYLQGFADDGADESFVTEFQLPVEPVSLSKIYAMETQIMEPTIVNKEAFAVVGLPFTGFISSAPYADGENNNEIGKVWDVFNARYEEVPNITGPTCGLCFAMPNDKEPWYIAGVEVSQVTNLPAGMISKHVPAQRYAVFPCTLKTISDTYRYITEEWQQKSGYEHAESPDFEYYDEPFDPVSPQDMKLKVYWPIK
ncbi:MerR family transcriptional regulator [bacterium]|nr:MerR family transcriptional regulator [bacterium]